MEYHVSRANQEHIILSKDNLSAQSVLLEHTHKRMVESVLLTAQHARMDISPPQMDRLCAQNVNLEHTG